MRVTNQMMAANVLTDLNTLRSRMVDVQQQISTGKRFTKNSEDPAAGGAVMRVQSRLQVMEQWDKNLGDARGWLRETETALGRMNDLIGKARELAVRGANLGPLNAEDRTAMAIELDELLKDLLAASNSQQTDGALFGGFRTSAPPFSVDMNTGVVTYSGDSGDMQRDVGPGVALSVNLHGNRLGDWVAPDNVLTAVWQLSQDLKNPDGAPSPTAMANNLTNMDKALKTVLGLRAEIGAKEKRLDQLEMHNKETYIYLNEILQQAQGVDMEKAIIDLNSAETTYRAALQVGARVIPPTLADFLR